MQFLLSPAPHGPACLQIHCAAPLAGVEAEAELLAAIVTFFQRLGISAADVGLKVSSRKVLQAVLERYGVEGAAFGPVCVVVDKMEKIPREKVGAGHGGKAGRVLQRCKGCNGGWVPQQRWQHWV